VVNHLVYDAYGNVTSETNSAVESLFLFTARPLDPDTGLQNNLNRWYDPAVGRWLSEDPIAYDAGEENLYRYTGNNPLTRVDPLGTDWGQCILERAYCKNRGTSRSKLIGYWRCRCPCDPPLQLDPRKPKYEPGVEEVDEYPLHPCEASWRDRKECQRLGTPIKRGDCSGRGGTKRSK
jgi:RHS repeat-associated protein